MDQVPHDLAGVLWIVVGALAVSVIALSKWISNTVKDLRAEGVKCREDHDTLNKWIRNEFAEVVGKNTTELRRHRPSESDLHPTRNEHA